MPLNWLAGAAAHAARRVQRLKREESVEALRSRPLWSRVAKPFPASMNRIIEIRFADPERGLLVPREQATEFEAARLATEAARGGAAAVAVWVERNFHAGDYTHLDAVRTACPDLYVIARDLVVDTWQLERCRAGGADAIELIPELLGPALAATATATRELGLEAVVISPDLSIRRA